MSILISEKDIPEREKNGIESCRNAGLHWLFVELAIPLMKVLERDRVTGT